MQVAWHSKLFGAGVNMYSALAGDAACNQLAYSTIALTGCICDSAEVEPLLKQ